MTYPYGTKGAPAVGGGLPGLPRRKAGSFEHPQSFMDPEKLKFVYQPGVTYNQVAITDVEVPQGVFLLPFVMVVAGGGRGSINGPGNGGPGGNCRWIANVSVRPGDIITLEAGGGRDNVTSTQVSSVKINGEYILRSNFGRTDRIRGGDGGPGGTFSSFCGGGGGGAGGLHENGLPGGNGRGGSVGSGGGGGGGGGGAEMIMILSQPPYQSPLPHGVILNPFLNFPLNLKGSPGAGGLGGARGSSSAGGLGGSASFATNGNIGSGGGTFNGGNGGFPGGGGGARAGTNGTSGAGGHGVCLVYMYESGMPLTDAEIDAMWAPYS